MRHLLSRRFEAVVFFTGASVLIVEIAAMRILSPYYGNTLHAVSSIIGVILGALSLGYWRGGLQADRDPSETTFYKIIFQAGVALTALFAAIVLILPRAASFFSMSTGPLAWSLLLFFVPGYLLGKCSPFAIVLAQKADPRRGLGQVTGSIFLWGTLGSISGSLATGFWLVPHFGLRTIFATTAAAILLLGGIGYARNGGLRRKTVGGVIAVLIAAIALLPDVRTQKEGEKITFLKDGLYQQLKIVDIGNEFRFFVQDSNISSGMHLKSSKLMFDYTQFYTLHQLNDAPVTRALFLGAGVYSMPKALHAELPEAQIDVVDIEPGLDKIAEAYFRLPQTPKIATHVADGRRFLHDSTAPYDFIFSDVYSSILSIPTHFTTKEFFALAKAKLAPGGLFIANIIAALDDQEDSFLLSEIRTMKEVFPNMAVLATRSPSWSRGQNFIFIGWQDDRTFDPAAAEEIIPLAKATTNLVEKTLDLAALPLEKHPLLTDDFAPVERLAAAFLRYYDKK